MRFEPLESRIVFDQSLGAAIEFDIDTAVDITPEPPAQAEVPADVLFRSSFDQFRYESDSLDPATMDRLVLATESWADNPRPLQTFKFNDTNAWRKIIKHNPISIHDDGYIVAERIASQPDTHTLLTVQKTNNDCYLHGGLYTRPDYHYRYSFDVRHPESEQSWLNHAQGNWAIVTELWGPRDSGETALEPAFSIYTYVDEGTPYWVVRSIGDSNRITTPGNAESYQRERIPMTNIGEWQSWDVEFVPNAYGEGLVRVWLNGDMVAEFKDSITAYAGMSNGQWTGPLNPSFGLYSYDVADGQEAHFDNIVVQCSGKFETSISGRISGSDTATGTAVFATNTKTGERFGTYTEKTGVYVLGVPEGEYSITALNESTGQEGFVENVSTLTESSQVIDIEVQLPPTPVPVRTTSPELTLTADVNGDGRSDIVNLLADGSWQVTVMDTDSIEPISEDVSSQIRRDRTAANTEQLDTSVWSRWSSDINWLDIQVADFNGDGLDDIAGRADTNGAWWVAESTGTGFQNRYWGKWTPGIDWINVNVGDFNGDGLTDIAGRADTNGSWWIAMSNGSGFDNEHFGRWSNKIDWDIVVGDFNGDGTSDIAGRAGTDGSWWVGESTGERFENNYWGRFAKIEWNDFVVGDFNGDGISDIAGRSAANGSFWVAESTGQAFVNHYWGRWNANIDWLDLDVADVNGDGMSDLVGRAATDGSWWIAESTGERFQNEGWGAFWSQDVDWLTAAIGDFDGDGAADLLGVNSNNWWLSV